MSREVLQEALELLAVATFIAPKLQAKRTDVINAGLKALAEQPAQQELVEWMELLREARDNCKASIVEEGISAGRKEYRIDLEARLTAALNTSPQPATEDSSAAQLAAQQEQEWIEAACALIKAADDAAHDSDYMLDSNDCIKVLRGQWKGPLMNDQPAQQEPVTEAQIVAGARVLNRRMADMCSIDAEDQWKQYGEDFRADARAVLEAAYSTKENT